MAPTLTEEQIVYFVGRVADYIERGRDTYRAYALELSTEAREIFTRFFSIPVLRNARLLTLEPPSHVGNPDFYPMLADLGFTNLPDQPSMSAITFNDTIVAHGSITLGTLFHELVHVEQYARLGVAGFADLYVRGFLTGEGYAGIPLERQAYDLQRRFERNPEAGFSVSREVAACLG
jgi:hypothetical protein